MLCSFWEFRFFFRVLLLSFRSQHSKFFISFPLFSLRSFPTVKGPISDIFIIQCNRFSALCTLHFENVSSLSVFELPAWRSFIRFASLDLDAKLCKRSVFQDGVSQTRDTWIFERRASTLVLNYNIKELNVRFETLASLCLSLRDLRQSEPVFILRVLW